MTQAVNKAHDRFFKLLMKDNRVACDFFKMHLPQDLQEAIQWETLKSEKTDHINRKFNESMTDIVFSVLINKKIALLHLIVDHQSTPDILMPFRSEHYRCNVIDDYVKRHPKTKTIPLVIPIVLYHGKAAWTFDTDIRNIVDAPRALVDKYAFKPFIFINLHKIEDEQLREHLWSGVMQLALKHIFEQDVLPYIKEMLILLHQLERKNAYEIVEAVLKYLLERGEMNKASFFKLVETELSPEIGGRVMTVAEQCIAEGRQQGVQLGVRETNLKTARAMLEEGLDISLVHKFTQLSFEEIRFEAQQIKR